MGRVLFGKLEKGMSIRTQNKVEAIVKSIQIRGREVKGVPAEDSRLVAFCVGHSLMPRKFYSGQLASDNRQGRVKNAMEVIVKLQVSDNW